MLYYLYLLPAEIRDNLKESYIIGLDSGLALLPEECRSEYNIRMSRVDDFVDVQILRASPLTAIILAISLFIVREVALLGFKGALKARKDADSLLGVIREWVSDELIGEKKILFKHWRI